MPLGLLSAFVLKLPPMWVYFILSLDETIKMPANIIHYRRRAGCGTSPGTRLHKHTNTRGAANTGSPSFLGTQKGLRQWHSPFLRLTPRIALCFPQLLLAGVLDSGLGSSQTGNRNTEGEQET